MSWAATFVSSWNRFSGLARSRFGAHTTSSRRFPRRAARGEAEWAFYRPRWGAFHDTALEARLRALGVNTLVVCGFNFTTAMRATIYEASARDFRIVLVSDAVGNASEAAVQEMARIGVYLMPSDCCLDWLAGATPVAA